MPQSTTPTYFPMHIGGADRPSVSGRTYLSLNPYTGEAWAEVPDGNAEDVDAAVAAARAALQGEWGAITPTRRGVLLRRLGELIARDSAYLAELETRDNGKLLREMLGQMASLPDWYCVLRRAGRQGHGRRDRDRQAELPRLHAPRAGRCGRRPSRPGTRR